MENIAFSGLFNYLVAVIGILYVFYRLSLLFLIVGREWLDPSASLEINNNEIVNHLNYYASGKIDFRDIEGTELIQQKGKVYLKVVLKQPNNFISQKSLLKRGLLIKLLKRTGTPLIFQEDELEYDLKDLQFSINNLLENTERTT